ncbi:MAG: histidinol-phosphate transaminase [Epsilonproteobacteria bacterium]|nr:MAG: histidinol-phosphate transaminase [Campylobacterota bacterium]RLA66263.1 MAG: histidinol-phosphate transaminase [Campylobacterota bacterium]
MNKLAETLVPSYIQNLRPYSAGKPIEELAREKGLKKISKLASNENPLGPSPFAVREMTNGLWELNRYPDMHAYKLKKALSDLYKLKMENIILGSGSEGIMGMIAKTFLRPDQEILTSENTFIGFYILARAVGAKLKMVPLKNYKFDVKKMAEAIDDKIKIIYLANPNNPTGTFITKEEFDYLMDHVPDHVLVILDEAYFEFAQDDPTYPDSMNYRYDNVITLRTFSKAYGLAGVRIGYGFAHEDLIEQLTKVKLPFEPNLIAQLGACGALMDTPHLKRTLENNKKQFSRTFDFLQKKDFNPVPSVTNFICFKTGSSEASDWMNNHLLDLGVIIRALKSNEMPEYVRVSIGTPNEMNHFFEAMEKILPEYNKKFGRPTC